MATNLGIDIKVVTSGAGGVYLPWMRLGVTKEEWFALTFEVREQHIARWAREDMDNANSGYGRDD